MCVSSDTKSRCQKSGYGKVKSALGALDRNIGGCIPDRNACEDTTQRMKRIWDYSAQDEEEDYER